MLVRTFIGLLAILASGALMAQAYRWVDENGVVHYSDRPQEGAEQIVLPRNNTRFRSVVPPRRNTDASAEQEQSGPFGYETIEIASPAPEETLWNIEGVLSVQLRVQPGLQPGHRVRVYFDGEPRMVNGTSFQIEEVYRGVHNIQAEILDENGALMGRSLPNRFYVQQNSIVTPN